jgi:secreted trypsin-like serine protease
MISPKLLVGFLWAVRQPQTVAQELKPLIIGGNPTNKGQYPYAQVSLQKPRFQGDRNGHECGGSLIAGDMILTAAHCIGWFTEVHIGRYDYDDWSEEYDIIGVKSTQAHDMFESNSFRFDFAVVLLEQAVSGISPVVLNTDDATPTPGTDMVVLGWGATQYDQDGAKSYPSKLMRGDVVPISNVDCQATVVGSKALYFGSVFDEMICAYSDGVDACSGDR